MEEVDHPLDVDYGLLDTTLELVDKKSKEFEVMRCRFSVLFDYHIYFRHKELKTVSQ